MERIIHHDEGSILNIMTLIMESSDNYVITCLEEVTGSIDLAKFIFYSHKEKENFIIASPILQCAKRFLNKNLYHLMKQDFLSI